MRRLKDADPMRDVNHLNSWMPHSLNTYSELERVKNIFELISQWRLSPFVVTTGRRLSFLCLSTAFVTVKRMFKFNLVSWACQLCSTIPGLPTSSGRWWHTLVSVWGKLSFLFRLSRTLVATRWRLLICLRCREVSLLQGEESCPSCLSLCEISLLQGEESCLSCLRWCEVSFYIANFDFL